MINDPHLLEQSRQGESSCMKFCCIKSKKTSKMFPQTMQHELYPNEWDPLPQLKNTETEVEEKNQNTQGIDQTRDEANMSNANPSPSPRAAIPVPGAQGNFNDAEGLSSQQNMIQQRMEESKHNEYEIDGYQANQHDSIRNEPDIAGAFNSVEQNLIAIENNNLDPAESSMADQTMQGRR